MRKLISKLTFFLTLDDGAYWHNDHMAICAGFVYRLLGKEPRHIKITVSTKRIKGHKLWVTPHSRGWNWFDKKDGEGGETYVYAERILRDLFPDSEAGINYPVYLSISVDK